MSLSEAVTRVLSQYAVFTGRAGRAEFWWWVLAIFVVMNAAWLLDGIALSPFFGFSWFGDDGIQPLTSLIGLALLLPNIAVSARRLHDVDRSGWWLLLNLIPFIGFIILLFFFIQPGTEGDNRYGEVPPR